MEEMLEESLARWVSWVDRIPEINKIGQTVLGRSIESSDLVPVVPVS